MNPNKSVTETPAKLEILPVLSKLVVQEDKGK